jgi:hypothetical protein
MVEAKAQKTNFKNKKVGSKEDCQIWAQSKFNKYHFFL